MVRFHGSYTDEENFVLLFRPVAECTLEDALKKVDVDADRLRRTYGCLAAGLVWLHDHDLRHKDIKPANILMTSEAEGSVLFCDFGSARDERFGDVTQTGGEAKMRTVRYMSPETHAQEARDKSSDVWSLGCVFLEVLTVLRGKKVNELCESLYQTISERPAVEGDVSERPAEVNDVCYWMGLGSDGETDDFRSWITQLSCGHEPSDGPGVWIVEMVSPPA